MNEYPQHDIINAKQDSWTSITEFLKWLQNKDIELARYGESGFRDAKLYPISDTNDDLVNEFIGIDSVALEAERKLMLEGMRE